LQLIHDILTNILVPPHPLRVDLYKFVDRQLEEKVGRAAACLVPNFYEIKIEFIDI
jgi:hypothetical protein